ncbi:MAG: hypothetical protein ACQ9MH_08470 [Nitrospinales bacterium]
MSHQKTSGWLDTLARMVFSSISKTLIFSIIFSLLIFSLPSAYSQEQIEENDKERIRIILLLLTRQAALAQEELDSLSDVPETPNVIKKRNELHLKLDGFTNNFESLATQLSTDDLLIKEAPKKDWINELQELTMPLLDAISELSDKPRKIEKLNKDIETLSAQLEKYEAGTKNLEALLIIDGDGLDQDSEDTKNLLENLNKLKRKYDPELVRIQLEESKRNLYNLEANQESFIDTVTNTMRRFFKSRGLNLLFSIGTFIALWWLLTRLRTYIIGKKSVIDLAPWLKKLLMTIYNMFVVLICLVASMVTLYLRNDWLLLSVIILFLFAVVWTSRQLIPKVFQEMRLGLNLGMVREGERLIWGGVPWLVTNIGLKVSLANERLEGAKIHLPLRELVEEHSRPVVKNEPWFPTQVNDWVFLSDGTYGKVAHQTVEQVVIMLKGNSYKYYPTAEFLNLAPLNISGGFRYSIKFGLDYSVQSKVCEEIPALFKEGLQSRLKQHLQDEDPDIIFIGVSFDSAGDSSLDLRVIIDVKGKCANLNDVIEREINTALVSICNENGLVIPFKQLSITLSEDSKPLTPKKTLSQGDQKN